MDRAPSVGARTYDDADRWLILADDLTGAADSAWPSRAGVGHRGLSGVRLTIAGAADAVVLAFDARSRRSMRRPPRAGTAKRCSRFLTPAAAIQENRFHAAREPAPEIAAMLDVLLAHQPDTAS